MKNELDTVIVDMITEKTSFMKWRPDYERWVKLRINQEDFQQGRIKNMVNIFGHLSQRKILDVGCGMGGLAVALKRTGFDVVALDPNLDYCRITKLRSRKYDLNTSLINGMGESLPFRSELFEIVCLFDVLEHAQNPEMVLGEVHRVLKPGGGVIITVINKHAFRDPHYHLRFINWVPKRLAEWYIRKRRRSKNGAPCEDRQKLSEMHYFEFNEFSRLARKAGFDIEDMVFRKINQPPLIQSQRMRKYAEKLKFVRLTRFAYLCSRFLSSIYSSGFDFILWKKVSTCGDSQNLLKLDIG